MRPFAPLLFLARRVRDRRRRTGRRRGCADDPGARNRLRRRPRPPPVGRRGIPALVAAKAASPPTLTTSSQPSQGLLGQPDTRPSSGGDRLGRGTATSSTACGSPRLLVGLCAILGVEGNAFFLERDSRTSRRTPTAAPCWPGVRNSRRQPGQLVIAVQARRAGERRLRRLFARRIVRPRGQRRRVPALRRTTSVWRIALPGSRFLQMRDPHRPDRHRPHLPIRRPCYGLEDHYRAGDAYYGGQVGLARRTQRGRWFVDRRGEVGLGGNVEQVAAWGQASTRRRPGGW